MKLKHAAFLASILVLAACGGGKQDGDVRFTGFAPVTAKDKDVREVRTFCPGCRDPIEVDTVRHKKKNCNVDIKWSESYRCPSCRGSGRCMACVMMEQKNGDCYNCKEGVLIFNGQSPECPNCKGAKKCPVCKGSQKCDYCEGGKIAKEVVKAKSAKFNAGSDNELPPSDPVAPDKKKDDAPKPEEKKEDAPAEPKKE